MRTGNNFVTTGPNQIDMIIRDPFGSGSYPLKTLEEHLNKIPEKQKPKTIKLNSGRRSKDKVKV